MLEKYANQTEDKHLIEHVVDQIWAQYDEDNSGTLEIDEAYDFMKIVLNIHEKMVAHKLDRPVKDITDDQVNTAMKDADTNHDGIITKDEMYKWVTLFMNTDEKYQDEKHACLEKHHEHGVIVV